MNKTVTINISGIIFHIEEDAYATLSKYIATIKSYFNNTDGGNEIMSDIEARIAEMLQAKTSPIKQVVLMSDVDFVMESMGKPEEFGGDQSDNTSNENTQTEYETNTTETKKRIYRDSDSKVIGGVCSGIGHYFGLDPVWLRIALALLLVFGGTGVLLYIILWIAIPEAKTTAEKLAMKGEKADINNISKTVKEEAEQLKKRMEKYGKEFSNMAKNGVPKNTIEKIADFMIDIFTNIGRILFKILGIFMVVFGVLFFLGLSGSVFGLSFITDDNNGMEWVNMLLLDGKDFYLGLIGIAIFAGVPIIMMIYSGVKILFKINYSNRWLNLSAGIIWIIGFFILLSIGLKTGSDFSKTAIVREKIEVQPHDILYLNMHDVEINSLEINESDDVENKKHKLNIRKRNNEYVIGTNKGKHYLLGHAQLNIIKSQTQNFELVIVKEAKGANKLAANDRAKNIEYKVIQMDSVIEFDNIFKVLNADKYRAQDVTVILKVPVGKQIYLDKTLEDILYNVENTTNTYDGDMINRRWEMTESGLKCIDCKGLDMSDDENDNESDNEKGNKKENDVKITVNGVDINSKNSKFIVDSNGVKLNSKTTSLTIDEKGIHIDTKKK